MRSLSPKKGSRLHLYIIRSQLGEAIPIRHDGSFAQIGPFIDYTYTYDSYRVTTINVTGKGELAVQSDAAHSAHSIHFRLTFIVVTRYRKNKLIFLTSSISHHRIIAIQGFTQVARNGSAPMLHSERCHRCDQATPLLHTAAVQHRSSSGTV